MLVLLSVCTEEGKSKKCFLRIVVYFTVLYGILLIILDLFFLNLVPEKNPYLKGKKII